MSNFTDLVQSRRSIRSYTEDQIPHKHLEKCVDAARIAPSACNSQPWKFIIVNDKKLVKNIALKTLSRDYGMNAFTENANAFIVIVSEKQKLIPSIAGAVQRTDYRLIDIGIACEHIVLQAQELSIGTCVLGWFNEKRIKKILSIPRSRKVELVISMGYASDKELKPRPLKDRSETIGYNRY